MSIVAMVQFISYLSLRFCGNGTVPNRVLVTENVVQPTQWPVVGGTNQCGKILLTELPPETCSAVPVFTPSAFTPSVIIVIPSPTTQGTTYSPSRTNDPTIIFSSNILTSDDLRVTFEESHGLQNQEPYCDISEDSPEMAHIATLWTKIVEVGVKWCCTSGPGCEVVAEYRSAEVALCAPRELCVRCLSISFALGRLMQLCERGGRVQGSMGNRSAMKSDSVPVVRVLPRLQSFMPNL